MDTTQSRMKRLTDRLGDDEGAQFVEYALLIAGVVVLAAVFLAALQAWAPGWINGILP